MCPPATMRWRVREELEKEARAQVWAEVRAELADGARAGEPPAERLDGDGRADVLDNLIVSKDPDQAL